MEWHTFSAPPLPPAPIVASVTDLEACVARSHTSTPGDVIGLDLLENTLSLFLRGDIRKAADKHVELSGKTST